jgi:hypothetical protein
MNLPDPKQLLASLVSDLRSRRLLPVVVLLAVGIVAIPLALSHAASPSAVSPITAVPPGSPAPTVGGSSVGVRDRRGHRNVSGRSHDPFVQLPLGSRGVAAARGAAKTETG